MNPSKMFFTADQHFGAFNHATKYRCGFIDPRNMDEVFIDAWNQRVPKQGGHVFCLGDFSVSNPKRTQEILRQLNGSKYLVIGNHDKGVNLATKELFKWVKPYHEQKVDWHEWKYRLIMCHYAFRTWNYMHHGSLNLHGHSHGNLPRIPAQLDVGIDSARKLLGVWAPFSMQDVHDLLAGQQAICEDHHQPPKGN